MQQSMSATLLCCLWLAPLVILSVHGDICASVGQAHDQRVHNIQHPQPMDQRVAMDTEKRAMEAYNSRLTGTTRVMVVSGVPGGQTTGGPRSIEFAIAPIEGDQPAYQKAIFVKSDTQGHYDVALSPGTYWIGPKAKALDPMHYRPQAAMFAEQVAVVKAGEVTHLDLVETAYAP
jgi:hypothetical protein